MKSVLDIIKTETLEPPKRVTDVMTLIRGRHAERVQAMVYYGSSMRELDAITLLPGESVTFEPGGRHLMIYTPQYEAQPESVQIEFLDRSGSVYSTTFDLLKNGPE